MTHNPYAPPTSNVADSSAVLPTRIAHAHVARACHLLWLSFGLAVLGATFDVFRASVSAGRSVTVIGAAAGATMVFLITLWFTLKLRAGRNWMRLLVTILNVGGLLLIPFVWNWYWPILKQGLNSPLDGVVTAGQWLLDLAAVVYVNTSGARAWFSAVKNAAIHAA
jgi:hypothetical protein